MKFTYRWLCEHLDTQLAPAKLGERLTMAGLELDGLLDLRRGLARIRVGQLATIAPHPGADRLTVCQVRVADELLPVVCGATNHRAGDKVAVAMIGAELPGGLVIKASTIRGQTSRGMLCSVKELGLADSADGIWILPPEAPCGAEIAQLLGRDDFLFDVATTPNRGDCLSVRGIAREMAAVLAAPLLPPPPVQVLVREDMPRPEVILQDGHGCPRYSGRLVRGVRIAASPDWLRQRLEAIGLRSINNVVDATNLVMMETGQPLHAFDLHRLHLPLVVRRAEPGETMLTLDGVSRTLTSDMTVIADQARPLALAGIMGGEESGVTDQTTDLLLESAYFDPIRVARTGRRLGITSESRYRFERGVDPHGLIASLDRLTSLILAMAGGEAGPVTFVDAGYWREPEPIPFRHERAIRLAGIHLSEEESHRLLQALGCQVVGESRDGVTLIQPPSWRHDLRREEDLMEEVVRLYGYDRVPSRLPEGPVFAAHLAPADLAAAKARRLLVGLGFLENINYAFVSKESLAWCTPELTPLALLNPLSEEQGVLRTALLPGLVDAARRNLSRGHDQLRFFEIGRVFLPEEEGLLREEERVAGLLCGPGERAWHTPRRPLDFFDLKGDIESLLAGLRLPLQGFAAGGPGFLHPGRCARMLLSHKNRAEGEEIGWMGQLHPAVMEALAITVPLLVFEMNLARLAGQPGSAKPRPLSRFPAVERDFALVVPADMAAGALIEAARTVDRQWIRQVALFDLYTGSHLASGMKGMGLTVTLQADDRTLTDADIQDLSQNILDTLAKRCGASLRGSSC